MTNELVENLTQEKLDLDRRVVSAILEHIKNNMPTITYGELADVLAPMANQGTNYSLGRIQNYCQECALPILSSMVVSKEEGKPSEGFNVCYRDIYPGDANRTDEEIVQAEQIKCITEQDWQRLLDYIDELGQNL